MNTPRKLIIIGSGPAGLTAAIYAARANLKPLVIDGSNPGGQLMNTSLVENWPGNKSIMGPTLIMQMRDQAQALGAEFLSESITRVDFSKKPFSLWTDRNNTLQSHAIIIATGATPKRLNVPGESTYWAKGITTCAVCDAPFYKEKKVVIIGGGDTAMEEASFLKKFTNNITIIQISEKLSASYAMQQRIITDPSIKIIYNSSVSEFKGNGTHLQSLIVRNQKTGISTEMTADGAFIAIGLSPNTQPFKGHISLNEWGYIDVKNGTNSSVEGVFIAGDVHDYRYRQAITAAGSGCMAALDAERYLLDILK